MLRPLVCLIGRHKTFVCKALILPFAFLCSRIGFSCIGWSCSRILMDTAAPSYAFAAKSLASPPRQDCVCFAAHPLMLRGLPCSKLGRHCLQELRSMLGRGHATACLVSCASMQRCCRCGLRNVKLSGRACQSEAKIVFECCL